LPFLFFAEHRWDIVQLLAIDRFSPFKRWGWHLPGIRLRMLGTGRPGVTLAAGALENAGLIENLRGTVKILNRKSLEQTACECYGMIQQFNGGKGLK
jgi:hypothetical protein